MSAIDNGTFYRPIGLPADQVIAVFDVHPSAWDLGRIRYTCSLCRSIDDGGRIHNPSVHGEMRRHLKRHHGMRGTSLLRTETYMDDRGAISAIEFSHT